MKVWALLLVSVGAASAAGDLRKAEDLYQQRHFREALAQLDGTSGDPAAQFLIGRIYFATHDLKKATDVFTKLTEEHADNSGYFDWLGKVYGQRAEEANPFSAAGLATKARDAFEKAVQLNGNNKDALSDVFDYYISAPGFMGGSTEKADAIAEKNLRINPQEGYLEKAKLAEKRKDLQEAETYLHKAIAAAPDAPGYYAELARFLSKQGRDEEADKVFAEARKKMPDAPRLWFAEARVLVKAKRKPDEARALLEKYLQAPLTADDPSPEEARGLLKQIS